eukprot:scaffold20238_cov65-Phaeocystis_antarctica.AAC.2
MAAYVCLCVASHVISIAVSATALSLPYGFNDSLPRPSTLHARHTPAPGRRRARLSEPAKGKGQTAAIDTSVRELAGVWCVAARHRQEEPQQVENITVTRHLPWSRDTRRTLTRESRSTCGPRAPC